MSSSRANENKNNKEESSGMGKWIKYGLVGGGILTLVEALTKSEPVQNDLSKSNLRPK